MPERISSKKRSYIMSRINSQDTKIEVILRKALWSLGYRYRKNDRSVFGTPDICFKKKKLAVFCDSSFWHGRNYLDGKIPENNRKFWVEKFKTNIKRDVLVNETLEREGWKVLRFWDNEINSNPDRCLSEIRMHLDRQA